jgi:hypothetical protein
MDVIKKKFTKVASFQYKCNIISKDENDVDSDKTCDAIVVVGKDSLWNLKRHLLRNHSEVIAQIEEAEKGISFLMLSLWNISNVYCSINGTQNHKTN